MSTYFIGDIHGCFNELKKLLNKIEFDNKKDYLWVTGDLVARGPESFKVLCFLKSLGKNLKLVLGNHDLHLISSYFKINNQKNKNYINYLLQHDNTDEIIQWLFNQPFLQIDEKKKIVMSHAGIFPAWDIYTAKKCAEEIHRLLVNNTQLFFSLNYSNNIPKTWNNKLEKICRWKFIINVFTKMRYIIYNKNLIYMVFQKNLKKTNKNLKYIPWFHIKNKINNDYNLVFGHWSCVSNYYNIPKKIFPLDTGCCWGKILTILRWEDKKFFTQKYLES